MFLVGDFSYRDTFDWDLKVKEEITKDDLAKAKNNSSFQVIDMRRLTYYDPEENEWKKIKVG